MVLVRLAYDVAAVRLRLGWDCDPPQGIASLTSIEIVPASSTIAAGTSTRLTVIGTYSGQFTRDVTDQAVWSSDNTAVAGFVTASNPNRVSGIAPGSAILKATVGGISNTSTLTVSNATIQAITITPAAPTIAKGLSTQLAASGTFSDGTAQDLTFDAAWTSGTPARGDRQRPPGQQRTGPRGDHWNCDDQCVL